MFKRLSSLGAAATLYATREKWYKHDILLKDAGGSLYGKLTYSGFFADKVQAEIYDETWSFVEKGFWNRVTLISDSRHTRVGEFKLRWGGNKGALVVDKGGEKLFSRPGIWKAVYLWTDPQRGDIIRFNLKGFGGGRVEVEILDNKPDHLLPLLILLGLHSIQEVKKHASTG